MDLYLFDFDKTLYRYDFRQRLPALAQSTGSSEYHLAKSWWAAGYEARAERGEWPTASEYFEQWEKVTGVALTVSQWRESRLKASTPIPGSLAALKRATTLGVASVFSNNPAPFAQELPWLAPDVVAIVGENRLVSCGLGARKPETLAYQRALEHFGVRPEDTFMADDSGANVAAAREVGMHAHHFIEIDGEFQLDALNQAIDDFAGRNR
ncbi:MAG: HAD-IA family hydrolase [Terrimesophilobacter sp.]